MGVLFQKKNAVRDGTLVLATKNTLSAQRKEAPCMQHAGGTSQLARMLTTQNNSFVQLTSVHPVWCLLYARCAFCAGRKAYIFLGTEPWLRCGRPWFSCYKKLHVFFSIRAKATTPLMTNSDVLRLLSSIERGTPSGGAPAHFASFYPFYSLQAFTAALRASVSLQGFW